MHPFTLASTNVGLLFFITSVISLLTLKVIGLVKVLILKRFLNSLYSVLIYRTGYEQNKRTFSNGCLTVSGILFKNTCFRALAIIAVAI